MKKWEKINTSLLPPRYAGPVTEIRELLVWLYARYQYSLQFRNIFPDKIPEKAKKPNSLGFDVHHHYSGGKIESDWWVVCELVNCWLKDQKDIKAPEMGLAKWSITASKIILDSYPFELLLCEDTGSDETRTMLAKYERTSRMLAFARAPLHWKQFVKYISCRVPHLIRELMESESERATTGMISLIEKADRPSGPTYSQYKRQGIENAYGALEDLKKYLGRLLDASKIWRPLVKIDIDSPGFLELYTKARSEKVRQPHGFKFEGAIECLQNWMVCESDSSLGLIEVLKSSYSESLWFNPASIVISYPPHYWEKLLNYRGITCTDDFDKVVHHITNRLGNGIIFLEEYIKDYSKTTSKPSELSKDTAGHASSEDAEFANEESYPKNIKDLQQAIEKAKDSDKANLICAVIEIARTRNKQAVKKTGFSKKVQAICGINTKEYRRFDSRLCVGRHKKFQLQYKEFKNSPLFLAVQPLTEKELKKLDS